jgi:hypothetical protein
MGEGSQKGRAPGNFSPLRAGLLGAPRDLGNDPRLPMTHKPRRGAAAGRSESDLPAWKGLVKIRAVPLVQRRTVELAAVLSGRWREIVDAADLVSEGCTRAEGEGQVYYGSTSVLLLRRSAGGALPDEEVPLLSALLSKDPHVRLRVLRIAWREATARAGGTLGTLRAEIDVAAGARGVSLLVEVVARLAADTSARRTAER